MTAPPSAIETIWDSERNLVCARYHGHVRAADFEGQMSQVERLLEAVKPGFRLLVDFTALATMDYDCAPHLARLMDRYREREVAQVVRVLPDPRKDIGLNILSVIHYRGRVPTMTVASLAEAEAALL